MGRVRETLSLIRSVCWMVPLLILITSLMGFLSLLSSLVDSRGEWQHRIAVKWGRMLMAVFRIELRLSGAEGLDPDRPYVFTPSHFSLIDTPLMFGLMPHTFRVLARHKLWRIPFIGWHLSRAGHLPVNRTNPHEAARNISHAAEKVREGRSILIFPEGGRRRTDAMRRFKTGAARIAIQSGVPIVPVAIVGTRAILPPGSCHLRPGVAEVRIGEPIATVGLEQRDVRALTERVRVAIEQLGEPSTAQSALSENGSPK